MATTVNSDLIIYNDEAQTAYLERVQDNLDVFNASSNGAMVLDNELIEGDFRKRALYKLNGSLEHRDVNSDGKVTAKKISAGEAVGVKAPWKYGPYQTTEEAFKRRGRPVEEFSQIVGATLLMRPWKASSSTQLLACVPPSAPTLTWWFRPTLKPMARRR